MIRTAIEKNKKITIHQYEILKERVKKQIFSGEFPPGGDCLLNNLLAKNIR